MTNLEISRVSIAASVPVSLEISQVQVGGTASEPVVYTTRLEISTVSVGGSATIPTLAPFGITQRVEPSKQIIPLMAVPAAGSPAFDRVNWRFEGHPVVLSASGNTCTFVAPSVWPPAAETRIFASATTNGITGPEQMATVTILPQTMWTRGHNGQWVGATGPDPAAEDIWFAIYPMMASNAAGRGQGWDATGVDAYDSNTFMFNPKTNQIEPALEPVPSADTGVGMGPANTFIKEARAKGVTNKFLIVNTARAGTGYRMPDSNGRYFTWRVDAPNTVVDSSGTSRTVTKLYNAAVAMHDAAVAAVATRGGILKPYATLVNVGTTDSTNEMTNNTADPTAMAANDAAIATWTNHHRMLVNAWQARVGPVPVIHMESSQYVQGEYRHNRLTQASIDLVTELPYMAFAESPTGLEYYNSGDTLHFSAVGQREMGRRMFAVLDDANADIPVSNSNIVAIIGDSNTDQQGNGWLAIREAHYPAGWLHENIKSYHVPGKTIDTPDTNGRITVDDINVLRTSAGAEPEVWEIALGANDIIAGDSEASLIASVNAILAKLNSLAIKPRRIVWIGLSAADGSPGLAARQAFNALAKPLVEAQPNGVWGDWHTYVKSFPQTGLWAPDGIHMTTEGYAIRNRFYAMMAGRPDGSVYAPA